MLKFDAKVISTLCDLILGNNEGSIFLLTGSYRVRDWTTRPIRQNLPVKGRSIKWLFVCQT